MKCNFFFFLFSGGLQLTFTFLVVLQGPDDEGPVALCILLAQLQRSVVLHSCADVPVAVEYGNQCAEVEPGEVLVEEKSFHVTVRADTF